MNQVPTFSVIVPVYEHWHLVPGLLEDLAAQTLPQERFEVLLVDNGSTRFTPPDNIADNVRILTCDTPGSYAARNTALGSARGAWLAFTDADCRPAPEWLAALERERRTLAAPETLLAGAVNMFSEATSTNPYATYDMIKGIPQRWYVSRGYAATANLAVPRAVVEKPGGFDETRYSGGDAEFCKRAVKAGYSIKYVPDAKVSHPARDTWEAIATKARRVKEGQLQSGPILRRCFWIARTATPPLLLSARYLRTTSFPWRDRLVAVAVQYRVWLLELCQLVELSAGERERR